MDLNRLKKIYMIGIKGVGMTMLAQFLKEKGMVVSGSDVAERFMTDQVLERAGIKIHEGFNADNLPTDADLIIYSIAYNPQNNQEMAKAKELDLKMMDYGQALGMVFNSHYGIGVAGSHGKTTTSAWLGFVLDRSGLKPSVLVGARVPQFGGNTLVGYSNYLVAEVDEYGDKLRHYQPKMVLLNNIDYDHPDFFPNDEAYRDVFARFIQKIPRNGVLFANFDDKEVRKIANVNCLGKVMSYAIDEAADFVAYDISQENGKQYFKVKMSSSEADDDDGMDQVDMGDFCISLSGRHNIYNALAVIATAVELEVPLVSIRRHLEDFTGASRRLEFLGKFRGADIYDDYAHHPTEIKTTLEGLRQRFPDRRLLAVFHPHTFTRTKALLEDFAGSFFAADELIVLDIYGSAREKQGGVSSDDLLKRIKEKGFDKVKHIPTLPEAEAYLRANLERGDLLLLLGAGDVFRIGENLLK